MKLILHHFAKDIHALRWPLLFSLALVIGRIGIDLLEAQPDYHLASTAEFIRSTMVLPLSGTLLWVVLLVRLIQSEPVIGHASFWLTRPTPRWVYIPSKLLFIALFLVLPYLIPTPLDMANYGVSTGDIRHALHENLMIEAFWTLVVLWLATFTLTLGQFGLRFVLFTLALTAIVAGSVYGRFFYGSGNLGQNGEMLFTRLALFVILLYSGLILSLLIQHAGRKGRAGFRTGLGFMIAATLAAFFSPIILPSTFTVKFLWGTSGVDQRFVDVHYADDWQQRLSWTQEPNTSTCTALSIFTPTAPPPPKKPPETTNGLAFQPGGKEVPIIENINAVTFQPKGEMPLPLSNGLRSTTSYPVEGQYDVQGAIVAEVPGVQIDLPKSQPSALSIFALNEAQQKQFTGKTGKLQLSLYGHLRTLRRVAEIPLNGSPLARAPGELIHVARLPRIPQPFVTNDATKEPVLAVWSLGYFGLAQYPAEERYYLLVDSRTHSGTFLHPADSVSIGDGLQGLTSKTSRHVYLGLAGDEPLDHMVLYIYGFKANDFFSTSLTAPNFTMNPAP